MSLSAWDVPASERSHPLDNPVWFALNGPHRQFGEALGSAVRYHPDFTPHCALSPDADESAWSDLAQLVGPGETAAIPASGLVPPPQWDVVVTGMGVQMVDAGMTTAEDDEAVRLGTDDVPEILDLIERAKPGPFKARTVELGTYLGIRREGRLVAMAGERTHLPGYSELSAICTDEEYRGHGLATRLVRAVGAVIRSRGETPFLHARSANTTAIRLYESLGFEVRKNRTFLVVRAPE